MIGVKLPGDTSKTYCHLQEEFSDIDWFEWFDKVCVLTWRQCMDEKLFNTTQKAVWTQFQGKKDVVWSSTRTLCFSRHQVLLHFKSVLLTLWFRWSGGFTMLLYRKWGEIMLLCLNCTVHTTHVETIHFAHWNIITINCVKCFRKQLFWMWMFKIMIKMHTFYQIETKYILSSF